MLRFYMPSVLFAKGTSLVKVLFVIQQNEVRFVIQESKKYISEIL